MSRFIIVLSIVALFSAVNALQSSTANTFTLNGQQFSLEQFLKSRGANGQPIAILVVAPPNHYQSQQQYGARFLQYQPQQQQHYQVAAQSQPLVVQAPVQPVNVHYKSQSVPLNVQHTHIPAPKPETKLSRSEEEAHVIVHEVIRPVIQEIREIIQPIRKVIQEVRPVQETVVSQIASSHQSKPVPVTTESYQSNTQS